MNKRQRKKKFGRRTFIEKSTRVIMFGGMRVGRTINTNIVKNSAVNDADLRFKIAISNI